MAEILKTQSKDVEVSELKGRLRIMDDVNRIRWEVQQGVLYRVSPCAACTKVAWWPEVRKDIWKYVKECTVCQKYKPSNPVPPVHESRGAWVHVRVGSYRAPSQR